jgi:broad specificity phosphatase PhoE
MIRHAEGTHNVNCAYRDIINLDARLTDLGKEQCNQLAQTLERAANANAAEASTVKNGETERFCPELVVTSPLTRCMQTAMLSFPKLTSAPRHAIPFVAHESLRETVNYACDRRRAIADLEPHFHERICFREIEHDHDELWDSYERRVGPPEEYDSHRESAELHSVADRAKTFFAWARKRPEQEIVLCTHSAFLRCFLNWGQPGGVPMQMPQVLDKRNVINNNAEDHKEVPVFEYYGDSAFEEYMRGDYANCELRSFVAAFPHP